jgi:hypothetical protein
MLSPLGPNLNLINVKVFRKAEQSRLRKQLHEHNQQTVAHYFLSSEVSTDNILACGKQ